MKKINRRDLFRYAVKGAVGALGVAGANLVLRSIPASAESPVLNPSEYMKATEVNVMMQKILTESPYNHNENPEVAAARIAALAEQINTYSNVHPNVKVDRWSEEMHPLAMSQVHLVLSNNGDIKPIIINDERQSEYMPVSSAFSSGGPEGFNAAIAIVRQGRHGIRMPNPGMAIPLSLGVTPRPELAPFDIDNIFQEIYGRFHPRNDENRVNAAVDYFDNQVRSAVPQLFNEVDGEVKLPPGVHLYYGLFKGFLPNGLAVAKRLRDFCISSSEEPNRRYGFTQAVVLPGSEATIYADGGVVGNMANFISEKAYIPTVSSDVQRAGQVFGSTNH